MPLWRLYVYTRFEIKCIAKFWRLELIKISENNGLDYSNLFVKKLKKRSLTFTSSVITLVLSACGRETRSTTEVALADESTNVPTAFNDKLIGSDDLDTFTALAGDDEIYGFGGNDQIIAGAGNDTIYGGDGDDNIQPGTGDDKVYGEGGNDTIYLSAGADIEDGGEGQDTIIFGPDQTKVVSKRLVRVLAWYYNALGFSYRIADVSSSIVRPL